MKSGDQARRGTPPLQPDPEEPTRTQTGEDFLKNVLPPRSCYGGHVVDVRCQVGSSHHLSALRKELVGVPSPVTSS